MTRKLAWRNIWRNKRRTLITLTMIIFAVVLSTLMMSIKEGVYESMIKSSAGDYSGYAQIHANGYWEDRTLETSFTLEPELEKVIQNHPEVNGYMPRVDGFALAATDSITKGSMVVGVDVDAEKKYSHLDERVSDGEYLSPDDEAILIGEGLAEYLKVGVGDTIVMLGSGYQGMTAVGKYGIKGIVKFGSPELSKQLVFLPMRAADVFFATYGQITTIALKTDKPEDGVALADALGGELGDEYEVMDWTELNPDLVTLIESDRVEGYVFMFILYMVISFGIFGTMLMMMAERRREFGVLVAVGMKRAKLARMVWGEIVTLSILGAFLGIFAAFPVCWYFFKYPISYGEEISKMAEEYGMEAVLRASLDPSIFIQQAIVVAIVSSLIALYPMFKLLKVNAVEEMRS